MKPKNILLKWLYAFNKEDANAISELCAESAMNLQVANEPVNSNNPNYISNIQSLLVDRM